MREFTHNPISLVIPLSLGLLLYPTTPYNQTMDQFTETTASTDGIAALYTRPGFLLRRAHQISVSLFMQAAVEHNVTTTQYGVLVVLRYFEGLDQIGVARRVGLDRSTAGLVIKKLEDNGLVVRIDDPKDKRRKIIVLTARGERTLEMLAKPAAQAQEAALAPFSPAEAEQFIHLLDKFVGHFNGITRAPIISEDD